MAQRICMNCRDYTCPDCIEFWNHYRKIEAAATDKMLMGGRSSHIHVGSVEQPPYALTDQNVAALERAIRAEGYDIHIDPSVGYIRLRKEGWDVPGNPWPALDRMRTALVQIREAAHMAFDHELEGQETWTKVEILCNEALAV